MKIYIVFEHDNDSKEMLSAWDDNCDATAEVDRLEAELRASGYSGHGGCGYHIEEIYVNIKKTVNRDE
jgi:hypothetical protein